MVIIVVPVPVTWSEVTSIVSMVVPPEFSVIFPVSTSTASSNVITKFEAVVTDVASSAGLNILTDGLVSSAEVKVQLVSSEIPA